MRRGYRDYRRSSLWRQVLLAVGLAVVALAAWIGYRAWTVQHELSLARKEISAVQTQAHAVVAGRGGGQDIHQLLLAPAAHAAKARANANDWAFRALGYIPWLGRPFRTATGVADAADSLARTTFPALATAGDYWEIVHDSRLANGVPVDFILRSGEPLTKAVVGLDRARHQLDGLPEQTWISSVDNARSLLTAQVTTLLADVRPAAAIAQLAPSMLARRTERHYLVAFQNRAEARGTGGLLGALALVDVKDGHLHVQRFETNDKLPRLATVPVGFRSDLADQSPALGIGTRWQNANYGADFRDAGTAWAAMYKAAYGVPIDGVLAIDPDGLAAILAVTGSVKVDVTGRAPIEIDSDNVANFVERDEYRLPIPREARKDVQRQIAQQVLDKLFSLSTSPLDLIDALTRTARLQHVLLMSMHSEEEERIAPFPVSGIVPSSKAPYVRLTVNNAAGSKLDYYLQTSLRYTVVSCGSPRRVRIAMTLENTAPPGLPAQVDRQEELVGPAPSPEQNFDLVSLYLTEGAYPVSAQLDGHAIGTDPTRASPVDGVYLRTAIDHRHPVLTAPLELAPGQERRLVITIEEPPSKAEPITPTQPMTNQTAVTTDLNACRAG